MTELPSLFGLRYTNRETLNKVTAAILAVVMLLLPLDGYASVVAEAAQPSQPDGAAARQAVAVPHGGARQQTPAQSALPDSIAIGKPLTHPAEVVEDEIFTAADGRIEFEPADTVAVDLNLQGLSVDSIMALHDAEVAPTKDIEDEWVPREVEFSPNPTRAVWMSALFPGLGQIYNRRYWKLPIVVGGYLGLAYATDWNNSMLRDYTVAYSDLLDNDPDTRSYMNLFSPNVKEENIDKGWLQGVIRSRRNYFRRNRDLCIICMVGVYLLAMVDAYVDASLSHFDITPDLTMDLAPALLQDGRQRLPSVGLMWALNF